jgi:tRNA(Ile)-lysidine synthase
MPHPFAHPWDGTAAIVLPHGTLRLVQARGTGIAARHVAGATVTIRSGVKGERLQMAGRASRRRVADLLREAGVPRWDRLALPRIYCDQSLAAVAPLGADAAFAAGRDEPGWALEWRPAATGA